MPQIASGDFFLKELLICCGCNVQFLTNNDSFPFQENLVTRLFCLQYIFFVSQKLNGYCFVRLERKEPFFPFGWTEIL